MTDSQQNPQPAPSAHRKVLENHLGKLTADAIVGVAREEALAVFNEKKEEIRQLVDQQIDVKRRAEELPAADKAAVAPQVNDANRQVREVVQDANDIDARQQAGEKVDPQELQDLDQRTDQARESSAQAAEAVERKAVAAERARQEHEAQQASRAKQPASAPAPSRATDKDTSGYATKSELAGLAARVDQIDSRSTDALNIAKAMASSESPTKRGSTWAIGTFVAVFLLYLVIWGISDSLEHRWFHQFAWPFGFGAVAYWLGAFTAHTSRENDDTYGQHSEENQHGHHPIWEGDRDHGHSTRTDTRAHA